MPRLHEKCQLCGELTTPRSPEAPPHECDPAMIRIKHGFSAVLVTTGPILSNPDNQIPVSDQEIEQYPGELVNPEPAPIPNDRPAVWDLVIADMQARDKFGLDKYNTRLQPFNGRDALKDAYQEALDLTVYLRQAIYERDGK